MEVKTNNFWWLKNKAPSNDLETDKSVYIAGEYNVSTNSLVDLFEKEAENLKENGSSNVDVDVGSIIEEINRVAAQSPLGPYNTKTGERTVDELMKEAERIYMESSKSFEQLSQKSKTSQNISELSLNSKDSTPTPKSLSPLPLDPQINGSGKNIDDDDSEFYSEDFSEESKSASTKSTPSVENKVVIKNETTNEIKQSLSKRNISHKNDEISQNQHLFKPKDSENNQILKKLVQSKSDSTFKMNDEKNFEEQLEFERKRREIEMKQLSLKNDLIQALEEDNEKLKRDIEDIRVDLEQTHKALQESKLSAKVATPDVTVELEKAFDDLKDSKEINTALQLQLETLTRTHVILKNSQDDLLNQNRNLERRFADVDNSLAKYKHELLNIQRHRDRLLEVEASLNKLLDIEKLQTKSLKAQNEADAKCIQDLNRQIKEMERIIARKHPDSVSALIMAAKGDATDSNLTARKLLEDRIKQLEEELISKEKQSSQVFADVQEKFNQMKAKYEHHIEDLELHVSDLKSQLKKKRDCFDMYTQTISTCDYSQDIPQKECTSIGIQTFVMPSKPPKVIAVKSNTKSNDGKAESHLIATIRGLQVDLSNKEKVVLKMQREIDELKRTNKRLQKEREGSLKSINEKKDLRNCPNKLHPRNKSSTDSNIEVSSREESELDKSDFEKIKQQLFRIEMDYQNLKKKRIHDLNALQEAHEREMSQYIQNLQPLREQLELQQLSINTLQSQLSTAKEELAVVSVERDHLHNQMSNVDNSVLCNRRIISDSNVDSLQKRLAASEKKYEEREVRLRAIINGLAQKKIMNRNCEQCAERQQQLIAYKMELDQILASLRALK